MECLNSYDARFMAVVIYMFIHVIHWVLCHGVGGEKHGITLG